MGLIFLLGLTASLIASAFLEINYFFKYQPGNEIVNNSFRNWLIAGSVSGLLIGGIASYLSLRNSTRSKDFSQLGMTILRAVILFFSTISLSATVWFFYTIDYFPLKDRGPLALLIGAILSLWDLSNRISLRLPAHSSADQQ